MVIIIIIFQYKNKENPFAQDKFQDMFLLKVFALAIFRTFIFPHSLPSCPLAHLFCKNILFEAKNLSSDENGKDEVCAFSGSEQNF